MIACVEGSIGGNGKARPGNIKKPSDCQPPFYLAWPLVNALPTERIWRNPEFHKEKNIDLSDGLEELLMMTTALRHANKCIRSFDIKNAPLSVFAIPSSLLENLSGRPGLSLGNHIVIAFANLETLSLGLAEYKGNTTNTAMCSKLNGLQDLLRAACKLKHLTLSFTEDYLDEQDAPPLLSYSKVFPDTGTWPHLQSLALCNMEAGALDLVHLSTARMPSLRHLQLTSIDVVNGEWSSVIECMHRMMRLSTVDLSGAISAGSSVVERYVLKCGRSPYLKVDEPDSASQKYMSELGF